MLFNCCFQPKKQSVGVNLLSVKEIDHFDFLAPSVHHLQTSFQQQIQDAGLSVDSTVYEIEDLRSKEPGLIRRKGLHVKCPLDGKMGSAYVHTLEGEDHVGQATYMLSYTWGYKVSDIVQTLLDFCDKNDLDTKRTYVWICALCNNQHRVTGEIVPFEEFQRIFSNRVNGIGKILAMMTPWHDPGYLKRVCKCLVSDRVTFRDNIN